MAVADEDKLKLYLKKAETEPVPFAFAPAKSGSTLNMHPSKQPKALLAEIAKENEEAGKGTFGTARVDGKTLILDIEKKIASLHKHVKAYLKESGLKQTKVVVRFQGQEVAEEAPGGGGGAPGDGSTPATSPTTPAPTPGAGGGAPAPRPELAAWAQTIDDALAAANAELTKLQKAILKEYAKAEDLRDIAMATHALKDKLDKLGLEGLTGNLREAAKGPANQAQRIQWAKDWAAEIQKRIKARKRSFRQLDGNPFLALTTEKTLSDAVATVVGNLNAA